MSPNGKTKNEIDIELAQHKHIVQDGNVLSSFTTGSGHRLVRCKIAIHARLKRAKIFKANQ